MDKIDRKARIKNALKNSWYLAPWIGTGVLTVAAVYYARQNSTAYTKFLEEQLYLFKNGLDETTLAIIGAVNPAALVE